MFDTISSHILDICCNSERAGASVIMIRIRYEKPLLEITISDNGCGIPSDAEPFDPFYTTKNNGRTGLGLPLMRESAESTGGSLKIYGTGTGGTEVKAVYNTMSLNFMSFGDIKEDIAAMALFESGADIVFEFCSSDDAFGFDTRKLSARNSITRWRTIRDCFDRHENLLEIVSCGKLFFAAGRKNMKIEELNAIRDKMKSQVTLRAEDPDSTKVVVAMGTCGINAGARAVLTAFAEGVAEKEIKDVMVSQTGCIGMCQYEPIVEIYEKGKDKVTYVNMNADKAKDVIEKHLIGGQVVADYTI